MAAELVHALESLGAQLSLDADGCVDLELPNESEAAAQPLVLELGETSDEVAAYLRRRPAADVLDSRGFITIKSKLLNASIFVRTSPDVEVPAGGIVFELEEVTALLTVPRDTGRKFIQEIYKTKVALGTDARLVNVGPAPMAKAPAPKKPAETMGNLFPVEAGVR